MALCPITFRRMSQLFNVVYKYSDYIMYKLRQYRNEKESLLIITPGQWNYPMQTEKRCPNKFKVLAPLLSQVLVIPPGTQAQA